MKLKSIGKNQTEITIHDMKVVFFSYETPVAAFVDGTFYRTGKKWSTTTTRHINQWLGGNNAAGVVPDAEVKSQDWFDSLTN